jgi:hypothetical protein
MASIKCSACFKWTTIFLIGFLIGFLIIFATHFLTVSLGKAIRKTHTLNTKNYKHEYFNLSIVNKTDIQIEGSNDTLLVFNISSGSLKDISWTRGIFMGLSNDTSKDIKVYLCSKNYGVVKEQSFCGTFKYEEITFMLNGEIINKRDYDFLVVDASSPTASGELKIHAMLETFSFGIISKNGIFWIFICIV